MTNGKITVTFTQGKASVGRGTYNDPAGPQPYLDYTDKPYPSSIDMKKATGVTFTPDMGKAKSFSKWQYLFTSGWVGPRLLVDGKL